MHRELRWIHVFARDCLAEKFFGKHRILSVLQSPSNHVPAEDINDDVELKIRPLLWTE